MRLPWPPGSVYDGGTGQSELDIAASDSGADITVENGQLMVDAQQNSSITQGQNTITGLDTSQLAVGESVTGTDIPNGTTIISIDTPTQITISNAAAATVTEPLIIGSSLFNGEPESLSNFRTINSTARL